MLILLAPSEGKTEVTAGDPVDLGALAYADELSATRERVLTALVKLAGSRSRKRARENLGLSATQDAELDVDAALRTAPAAPAAEVYTGVLYQHLAFEQLSVRARARATDSVLVASALWGVVGLADRIPAYRLSMNATIPSLRRTLAAVWRKPLAAALPDDPGGLVLDLRSGAYASAWQPQQATAVQVRALTPEGKVISHMAKATRGRVARAVLEADSEPREPDALARLAGPHAALVEPTKPGAPYVVEVVARSAVAG